MFKTKLFNETYEFKDVKEVMNRASSIRQGDILYERAARSNQERVAAKAVLANMTLKDVYENPAAPYEKDEITRLIQDQVNTNIYDKIKNMTFAEYREWILDLKTRPDEIIASTKGMTSEMVAALAKIMSNLDLAYVCSRLHMPKHCNTWVGADNEMACRLQPNDSRDDLDAIEAVTLEGLAFGCGDAMVAINPVEDNVSHLMRMYERINDVCRKLEVPTQTCILSHVTTQMKCAEEGADVDMIFQSLGGSEGTNETFGINVAMIDEAKDIMDHRSSSAGPNRLYFETGEGTEDSAGAAWNTDQATMESRCYGFARRYDPFLIDTVLGFLGAEYIYDRQQHLRCGIENMFCAKMQEINIGQDSCYVVSMDMQQNDNENTAMILTLAGSQFLIAIPQGDDPMLMYQSIGFHDVAALREISGKKPAPEFTKWMEKWGLWRDGHVTDRIGDASIFMTRV